MKKMKKTFACLLAVLLIFGIMPTGVFADETSDGESTDEPHYKVAVQLTDSETDFTNGNPYYSLEGSVYDIYKDVDDPDNYPYWEHEPCATTQATDANGYCEVPGGLPSGNYVAIMRTRATGYRYDRNHYVFGITDKDVLLTAIVKPSSITMNIYKNDRDYGAAAGDATLGGAVYRVYYPQGTGETYSDITTDETGFAMVENMPFGQIRVQEITAPTGYKLDPIVHTYNITSGGNEEPFVLDNFSLRDEVIKGKIAIKTQSDIAVLSLDTLDAQDRKFEVYLASAGSYNDAKETERDIVTADENGTALTKLLPYGTYTVREIGEDGEVLSEGFNARPTESWKKSPRAQQHRHRQKSRLRRRSLLLLPQRRQHPRQHLRQHPRQHLQQHPRQHLRQHPQRFLQQRLRQHPLKRLRRHLPCRKPAVTTRSFMLQS